MKKRNIKVKNNKNKWNTNSNPTPASFLIEQYWVTMENEIGRRLTTYLYWNQYENRWEDEKGGLPYSNYTVIA